MLTHHSLCECVLFKPSKMKLALESKPIRRILKSVLDKDLDDHLISDCADFKDHSFVLELLHECFNLDILATDFGFGGSSIYSKLPHITKDGLFYRIIPNTDLDHIIFMVSVQMGHIIWMVHIIWSIFL